MPCFMLGVVALFFGFVAAEIAALRHWRGSWRALAVVPVVIVGFVAVRIVVEGLLDPTSHNLWPFEILIWCGVGLVVLGLAATARAHFVRETEP